MRRILLYLSLFAVSLTATTRTASNDEEFRNALGLSTGGDVILLSYDVVKVERFLDKKTFSPPLTIRAVGNSGSLVCANAANDATAQNCFIDDVNGVIFDGLAIDGGINGVGWDNVTFQNLRAWDRGRVNDGVLLKQSTDCRGISVLDSTFDGSTRVGTASDMIDLIECDDSRIIGNTVKLAGYRAFVQAKGGTQGIEIAWNRITGGLRPLQLGGQFDNQTRRSALLAADVHDNYIADSQACMAISGVNGLKIRRNTCKGQTTFLFRVLIEQANIDPNKNVEWVQNAFLNYSGSELINQSANSPHDFASMRRGPNFYDFNPAGWPDAIQVTTNPTTASGPIAVGPTGVLGDAELAKNFGVSPSAVPDPEPGSTGLYWTLAGDGTVKNWGSYSEARADAMTNPCAIKLFRAVGGVNPDFEALRYSGQIELIPVVTLPEVEPTIGSYHVPGIPFDQLRVFEMPEPTEQALAACCGPWCESQTPGVILRGCACLNWLDA